MAQEEIMKIKAEIFDIICQQEEYVAASNTIQQEKNQKIQHLRNIEKTSSAEDIIKLKAEIFDIILKREEYIAVANEFNSQKPGNYNNWLIHKKVNNLKTYQNSRI